MKLKLRIFLATFLILLILGLVACTPTEGVISPTPTLPATMVKKDSANMLQIKVELDMSSGMPNPGVSLSHDQVISLTEIFDSLPTTHTKKFFDGLGNRGFVIIKSYGEKRTVIRVQNGYVKEEREEVPIFYRDAHRSLEAWLLETVKAEIHPDFYELLKTRINKGEDK